MLANLNLQEQYFPAVRQDKKLGEFAEFIT